MVKIYVRRSKGLWFIFTPPISYITVNGLCLQLWPVMINAVTSHPCSLLKILVPDPVSSLGK